MLCGHCNGFAVHGCGHCNCFAVNQDRGVFSCCLGLCIAIILNWVVNVFFWLWLWRICSPQRATLVESLRCMRCEH